MISLAETLTRAADGLNVAQDDLSVLDDILQWVDCSFVVGNGHEWRACSRAFTELTGWDCASLREATAENWNALVHPDDRESVVYASADLPAKLTTRYLCRNGRYRKLLWSWGPPGESGCIVATVVFDYGWA